MQCIQVKIYPNMRVYFLIFKIDLKYIILQAKTHFQLFLDSFLSIQCTMLFDSDYLEQVQTVQTLQQFTHRQNQESFDNQNFLMAIQSKLRSRVQSLDNLLGKLMKNHKKTQNKSKITLLKIVNEHTSSRRSRQLSDKITRSQQKIYQIVSRSVNQIVSKECSKFGVSRSHVVQTFAKILQQKQQKQIIAALQKQYLAFTCRNLRSKQKSLKRISKNSNSHKIVNFETKIVQSQKKYKQSTGNYSINIKSALKNNWLKPQKSIKNNQSKIKIQKHGLNNNSKVWTVHDGFNLKQNLSESQKPSSNIVNKGLTYIMDSISREYPKKQLPKNGVFQARKPKYVNVQDRMEQSFNQKQKGFLQKNSELLLQQSFSRKSHSNLLRSDGKISQKWLNTQSNLRNQRVGQNVMKIQLDKEVINDPEMSFDEAVWAKVLQLQCQLVVFAQITNISSQKLRNILIILMQACVQNCLSDADNQNIKQHIYQLLAQNSNLHLRSKKQLEQSVLSVNALFHGKIIILTTILFKREQILDLKRCYNIILDQIEKIREVRHC